MHRLLRFYRQNRMAVWVLILGIIFIILVIQVLNSISRRNMEEENRKILEEETTLSNVVSYDNQSESIISDEDVPEQYREDFGNLIEQFFNYCTQHEPQKAYSLLSQDTIDTLYPTVEIFESFIQFAIKSDMQIVAISGKNEKMKLAFENVVNEHNCHNNIKVLESQHFYIVIS